MATGCRIWMCALIASVVIVWPCSAQTQDAVREGEARVAELVRHKDPEEADLLARQWREAAVASQDPTELILADIAIGWLHRRAGGYDKAVLVFRQVLDRMDEQTPPQLRARVLADLGITYALAGLQSEALEQSREALALFRQLGDDGRVSATLGNIGNLLSDMGQIEAAREHYRAALEMKRAAGNGRGIGGLFNNLADLAAGEGDNQEARALLLQAIEANRAEGNRDSEALSLLNLVGVEADLGLWPEAEQHLAQALPLIGDNVLPLRTLASYEQAKLALRRYQASQPPRSDLLSLARRELLRASDLGKQIDDPRKRRKIALLGVDIESSAGDYRRALEWQQQAESERAELDTAQASARQTALSAQYLDERRNRELLELRAKEAQQEQERAAQRRKVWLLGGLLAVLAAAAFHLLQRGRWRQLQSASLAAHVEALEGALDNAERMRQKAENLAELNKQLLRVVGDEVRRPALQVRRQAERLLVNDLSAADRVTGLSAIAQAASELLRTSEHVLENSAGVSASAPHAVDLMDLLMGLTSADRRVGEPRIDLHYQESQRPRVAVDGARLQLIVREWLALAREIHGRDERLVLNVQVGQDYCRLKLDDPGGVLAQRFEQARDVNLEGARLGVLWLSQAVVQIGGRWVTDTAGPLRGFVLELPLESDSERPHAARAESVADSRVLAD